MNSYETSAFRKPDKIGVSTESGVSAKGERELRHGIPDIGKGIYIWYNRQHPHQHNSGLSYSKVEDLLKQNR